MTREILSEARVLEQMLDGKICSKCGDLKAIDLFYKKRGGRYGRQADCKDCVKEYNNSRKEHRAKYMAEYSRRNRKELSDYMTEYREKNRKRVNQLQREYVSRNKEAVRDREKEHRKRNKEKIREYNKKYRKENREKLTVSKKEYYEKNKKQIIARQMRYIENNPLRKLALAVRIRLCDAIRAKGFTKTANTAKYLGCDWDTFRHHLESQFEKGMSLDNHGEWHIDHIIPLASAETEKRLRELFHYTNTQPLWAKDNLSKGAKMPEQLDGTSNTAR